MERPADIFSVRRRHVRSTPQPILTVSDPDCSPDVLASWANFTTDQVLMRSIASHPNCPLPTQILYAEKGNTTTRIALLSNPNLSYDAVRCLQQRTEQAEDAAILAIMLDMHLLNSHLVTSLADSPDAGVRELAAAHSRDVDTITRLCGDISSHVREAAISNNRCSDEGKVMHALYGNGTTP